MATRFRPTAPITAFFEFLGRYWRSLLIIVVALGGWMILWPSIPGIAPPWVQNFVRPRMNLGLDIRGGARLSYDVQIGMAIAARRDRAVESIREQLARDYSFLRGDGHLTEQASQQLATKVSVHRSESDNRALTVTFVNAGDIATRITPALWQQNNLAVRSTSGNSITAAIKQEEVTALEQTSVEQAKVRIENRIDELAVKETSITSRGETIVIEVPGSDRAYFDQIRDIIRQTARLEFRLCADGATVLDRYLPGGEGHPPEGITAQTETVSAGQDDQGNVASATRVYFRARGVEGRRALVEFTHTLRTDIGETYDLLVGEQDDRRSNSQVAPGPDQKLWRTYLVEHIANVTGDMISSADVQVRQDTNQPYVGISFKPDGTRAFSRITTENVHKRFAIVLDERVMSAPVINEPIRNGSAQITLGGGDYRSQMTSANDLMVVLRAGALPAPLSEGTTDFIGPTLGHDTIRKALIAAGSGIGLVLTFMAIFYGWSGFIANGAVLLNLMLQLAAIALLGATMTLPGFAGLALTVGMAVDSNVLINERIMEELRAGKSLRASVDAGYEHAFSAIFDGHVTTFISGVVLLQYGTGPIKGFAVTLLIGIVANLFTGVFVTRVIFDWLVRGLRVRKLFSV